MNPERWTRVKEIFAGALDQPEASRAPYLLGACGSDSELRSDVERLLAQAGATLKSPAAALLPHARALASGEMLAHFRVDSKLGEGGMGSVYRAFDTTLQRPVALKVLPVSQLAGQENRDRLMREARAASSLNHPHIVTIYEIGSGEGVDYIAMECVEGQSLVHHIPSDGLPVKRALTLAIEIADALTQAHLGGVVHRDLKPGNIMLTAAGHIKLLDFGLAQRAGVSENEATTTAQGEIAGTPAYMSPEQAEGQKADERSDVFSFGAVLYEMLTGRRPFGGNSSTSVMASVLRDDPAPLSGIPEELEKIVARCLLKEPNRRFQSMSQLRNLLEEIAAAPAALPPAPRSRPSIAGWVVAIGVAVVSAGALIYFPRSPAAPVARWTTPPPAQTTSPAGPATPGRQPAFEMSRAPAASPLVAAANPDEYLALPWIPRLDGRPPMKITTLAAYPGMVRDATFSPDGKRVAFSWNAGGGPQSIYVKPVGSEEKPQRLTYAKFSDEGATWSPHGSMVAFRRSAGALSGLYMVPPTGGAERMIALSGPLRDETLPQMSWEPDGNWLAAPESNPDHSTQITLFSVHSNDRLTMTYNDKGIDHAPAISPDGAYLAYASCTNVFSCDVYVLPLGRDRLPVSRQATRLTHQNSYIRGITWMQDSRSLVYAAGQKDSASTYLWGVALFPPSAPRRLDVLGSQARHPTVSPNGARLAFTQFRWNSEIWRYDAGGTDKPSLGQGFDSDPSFSPDGAKFAYSSRNSGTAEIWVADHDGSNKRQLTDRVGREQTSPAWSPDGRVIAFTSRGEDGLCHVYAVEAAGGKPVLVTPAYENAFAPSWSRDGKSIYFGRPTGESVEIWRISGAGGTLTRITDKGGLHSAESFDGQSLYYTKQLNGSQPGNRTPLYVRPLSSGPEVKLLDNVRWYAFAVTSGGIYYLTDIDPSLAYYDFATRQSRGIAKVPAVTPFGRMTASPDGRTILLGSLRTPQWSLMLIDQFR